MFINALSMDIIQITRLRPVQNVKKVAHSAFQKFDATHVMKKITISLRMNDVLKTNAINLVKPV